MLLCEYVLMDKSIYGVCRTKHLQKRQAYYPNDHQVNSFESGHHLNEFIRLCPWEAEALATLSSCAKHGIVEIGRYNGGSTLLMALSNKTVPIDSIDICPQDDSKLLSIFSKFEVGTNVKLHTADANTIDPDLLRSSDYQGFDLLFIDGDHTLQGCLSDLNTWYSRLAPGGVVVLHDCYNSQSINNNVLDALLAFIKYESVSFIIPPPLTDRVYENRYGSICAFAKASR